MHVFLCRGQLAWNDGILRPPIKYIQGRANDTALLPVSSGRRDHARCFATLLAQMPSDAINQNPAHDSRRNPKKNGPGFAIQLVDDPWRPRFKKG